MEFVRAVDTSLYQLEAVEAAAEDLRGRCSVEVALDAEGRARVSVDAASSEAILEFWNRALEFALVDRF